MPWFWGSKRAKADDDDDSSEYESYSDDDEEASFYSTDDDEEEDSQGEVDEHSRSSSNNEGHRNGKTTTNGVEASGSMPPRTKTNGDHQHHSLDDDDDAGGIHSDELEELIVHTTTTTPTNAKATERAAAPTTDGAVVMNNNNDYYYNEDANNHEEFDELLSSGTIPNEVKGNRERLPSALSLGDDNEDDNDDDASSKEEENKKETAAAAAVEEKKDYCSENNDSSSSSSLEEDEQVTDWTEKYSLLVLAAEHDRVDILQAILNDNDNDNTLLNPTGGGGVVPPLHIAVSYGSVNAVNCLLRMGADPSIAPQILLNNDDDIRKMIPHAHRFDGVTAWELAFADDDKTPATTTTTSKSWFHSGASSSTSSLGSSSRRNSSIAPSKRQGIRHAFTAEALRCIGSDEVERLQQLLAAGMPVVDDMCGSADDRPKTLLDWCVDLNAVQCQEAILALLQAQEENNNNNNDSNNNNDTTNTTTEKRASAVLDRGCGLLGSNSTINDETTSVSMLTNRLNELEELARALSTCLDNLAEEVSVCCGLLLAGGGSGGSALATHVRSLKATRERKHQQLERYEMAYENSQDELAYWVRECGGSASMMCQDILLEQTTTTPLVAKTDDETPNPDETSQQRQQLRAQIAASENKIRMLRASIADLSEENVRNLAAVEQRGLSGGVHLVRGLRDEIRQLEFQLDAVQSAEATCRAKIITLMQRRPKPHKEAAAKNDEQRREDQIPLLKDDTVTKSNQETAPIIASTATTNGDTEQRQHGDYEPNGQAAAAAVDAVPEKLLSNNKEFVENNNTMTESERIATGQSTAIVVRQENNGVPFSLWQLLLRMIGLVSNDDDDNQESSLPRRSSTSESRPVMIL